MENAFWAILDEIADHDGTSTPQFLSALHSEVLELKGEPQNFTSVLRTTCLIFLSKQGAADAVMMAAE
jgi:predicted DNA-binding ribbon-helix-helix protein